MMYGNFTERELDAFWIGVESEQTRIIKLLESIKTYPSDWDYDDPFTSVIPIIKGEMKNDNTNF